MSRRLSTGRGNSAPRGRWEPWLRGMLLSCLAVALFTPASAYGQGLFGQGRPVVAPPPSQDTAVAAPQAIPAAEIPLRSEAALARLRAIETQLSFDPDIARIEEKLPAELADIARAHERLGRIVLEQLSIRELSILESAWKSHAGQLSDWAKTFEDELQELQDASQSTREIRDRWQLTVSALADGDGVPEAVATQARRVLESATTLRSEQRGQLEHVLSVKSQLDEGLDGVRHVLRELETARASVRGRTLSQTAPPIWRLTSIREQSASQTAARTWGEDWKGVSAFVSNHQGRILLNAALFLALALLAVRLRKRIDVERESADESLAGAAETLRRPVSAALLMSLFIANGLYPRAPLLVWQLLALVAIVPLYRLLPRSRSAVVNGAMRSLLVLFGAASLAELLVPPSFEYRLVNLGLACGLALASGWLLHSGRTEITPRTGWTRVVWRGLQFVFWASIADVLANVLGFTLLSESVLAGVLYAAYFSLAVVIGYRVIAGVIRLLPRTVPGQASRIMRDHGDLVTARAITVLKIASLGVWAVLALESFEIAGALRSWVVGTLTASFRIGALEVSLATILAFVITLVLALWIARFVRFVLESEVLPRLNLKRGVGSAVATVTQWIILAGGLVVAASAAGFEAGQLAIVFGALSVGIGFGLQNIVSNFVSGLILIFEQPVKVGDKVEITSLSLTGEVQRIGIRASVVRTFDGAEVIVPNGNLISSEVVNWTLSDQRRRVQIEVGVAYGTDPHRVIEILKAAAAAHREVLKYPEPWVIFRGFGASSLDFRLLFWTATFEDFFRVRSELSVAVHDALVEADITIPFPQRDLHFKNLPASGTAFDIGTVSPAETASDHAMGEPAPEPEGRV